MKSNHCTHYKYGKMHQGKYVNNMLEKVLNADDTLIWLRVSNCNILK